MQFTLLHHSQILLSWFQSVSDDSFLCRSRHVGNVTAISATPCQRDSADLGRASLLPAGGTGSGSGPGAAPTRVAEDEKHPGIQSRIGTGCQEFLLRVSFPSIPQFNRKPQRSLC